MPSDRLLSTDPQAGTLLSADPNAGLRPPPSPRRQGEPSISGGGYFEQLPGAQGMRWHPPEGSGSDLTRPDNSLLGMPPEAVVVPAVGVTRAVTGAVGTAPKIVAGAKAVVSQAAPAVKYEATRTALTSLGMPNALATTIALGVSGYGGGAKPRAPRAPRATASAPVAAPTPAPPTAPAVPTAPVAAPPTSVAFQSWSPQRIRNEVGLAYRRSGLKLSDEQLNAADDLVAQGTAPAEAIRSVATGAKVSAAPAAAPAAAAKPRLNPAETKVFVQLLQAGKSPQQAMQSIEQQRVLASMLGTPSTQSVQAAVAERNATGRWRSAPTKLSDLVQD